tara:strand:+ start:353 stop:1075 length:723 start_codon:yes stop_codon:yes gene_type:complete
MKRLPLRGLPELVNEQFDVWNNLTRRSFVSLGGAFLASGCAVSPVLKNAYDAARFLTVGMPDVDISRDLVDNIPYASISAKVGKGPRSLLILGRYEGEDLHWLSADNASVVTRDGRVVKTSGFPENIRATNYHGVDPVARQLHRPDTPRRFSRSLDIDVDNQYGLIVDSEFTVYEEIQIKIIDLNLRTMVVEETNRARSINWSFTNYYWVDVFDGFVWRSVQHIARTFPPIEIEVLKPAA